MGHKRSSTVVLAAGCFERGKPEKADAVQVIPEDELLQRPAVFQAEGADPVDAFGLPRALDAVPVADNRRLLCT